MTDIVIRAEGLGKHYRLGARRAQYPTLRETVAEAARGLLGASKEQEDETSFWALRELSFEVERGDVVGVVGRNGAGKSTLLKILSRITEPTEGTIHMKGRVGSLLEVGTGFHPELSGRENVFLNGAILGMKRREIEAKFDEIVAFAEIERFIDTAVKHYSSGMGLRLGFAVAAHLEPEILIVDEVLAVGDAAFQKKCIGKMGDVAKHGRTVLFVSHNMTAVKTLCNRGILLEGGRLTYAGQVSTIVEKYLAGASGTSGEKVWTDPATRPGNEKARLVALRARNEAGTISDQFNISEPVVLEVEYEVLAEGAELNLSLAVYNQDEAQVFVSTSVTDEKYYTAPHPVGRYRSRCVVPGHFLNAIRYSVSVFLVERARHILGQAEHAISMDVTDDGQKSGGYFGPWGGMVRPTLPWKTIPLE